MFLIYSCSQCVFLLTCVKFHRKKIDNNDILITDPYLFTTLFVNESYNLT